MENREQKKNLREAKLKLAVAIGYFNHSSVFLNVLVTVFVSVLSGMTTIGITNTIVPLIEGNYVHMIFMLIIFSILELVIRYLFYAFNFQAVLRTRGIFLIPYNLMILYVLESFFNVEFVNFFAVIGFVLLFSIIRSGVLYIFDKLKKYFSKEV